MIRKIVFTVLGFAIFFVVFGFLMMESRGRTSFQMFIDNFIVGALTGVLYSIGAILSTKIRLNKLKISLSDYDWNNQQYENLPSNIEKQKIIELLKNNGYSLLTNTNDKTIFKSDINFWTWGDIIEINWSNNQISCIPANFFAKLNLFFDFGQSKIQIQKISRLLY